MYILNAIPFVRDIVSIDHWKELPELLNVPDKKLLKNNGKCRPLYLRIETINICNNRCIICAYSDQTRHQEVMTMQVFKKAVEDYVSLGGGYLSLTPLVGEILLDPNLLVRLNYLESCEKVIELGVTTNATMAFHYSDDELKYILGRFSKISISVYGVDPIEYYQLTQRTNFKRTLEGIRRIITLSSQPVSLEFRLLKQRPYEQLCDWVNDEVMLGVNSEAWALRARINSFTTNYANWGIYNENNNPLPGDAQWINVKKGGNLPQCLIPIFACMVFSNGNISFCPCDNFNDIEELRLGNIMKRSLSSMYNSRRAYELWHWERYGTPEFCKHCSFHISLGILQTNPTILSNPHQIVGAG
jgi:radical SAM protein with 4Fe4S-binding SPASM domain